MRLEKRGGVKLAQPVTVESVPVGINGVGVGRTAPSPEEARGDGSNKRGSVPERNLECGQSVMIHTDQTTICMERRSNGEVMVSVKGGTFRITREDATGFDIEVTSVRVSD